MGIYCDPPKCDQDQLSVPSENGTLVPNSDIGNNDSHHLKLSISTQDDHYSMAEPSTCVPFRG